MVDIPRLPQVLRAYLSVHGIEPSAIRPDGRIALTFDGRWRVQVRLLADGRLVLFARVLELDAVPAHRVDDVLMRLGHYAGGLIRDHRSTLALDGDARMLLLQEVLAPELTLPQLEQDLGDFLNVLAFWNRTGQMEAAGR